MPINSEFSFSRDDLVLMRTPDHELLVGIESSGSCDGSECGAPVSDPGLHSHLRIGAREAHAAYVRFVDLSPSGRSRTFHPSN